MENEPLLEARASLSVVRQILRNELSSSTFTLYFTSHPDRPDPHAPMDACEANLRLLPACAIRSIVLDFSERGGTPLFPLPLMTVFIRELSA
jgi:hypothetical protein